MVMVQKRHSVFFTQVRDSNLYIGCYTKQGFLGWPPGFGNIFSETKSLQFFLEDPQQSWKIEWGWLQSTWFTQRTFCLDISCKSI